MTRTSTDEIRDGRVFNGYDYNLQVWVSNGVIDDCAHPAAMQDKGCCSMHQLRGKRVVDIPEAEHREPEYWRKTIQLRFEDQRSRTIFLDLLFPERTCEETPGVYKAGRNPIGIELVSVYQLTVTMYGQAE